jgi:hypothetical protein
LWNESELGEILVAPRQAGLENFFWSCLHSHKDTSDDRDTGFVEGVVEAKWMMFGGCLVDALLQQTEHHGLCAAR